MKKLVTLDAYNASKADMYRRMNDPRPNGIACPQCGEELMDSDPLSVLASNPPQRNVHCRSCDYRGYRIS